MPASTTPPSSAAMPESVSAPGSDTAADLARCQSADYHRRYRGHRYRRGHAPQHCFTGIAHRQGASRAHARYHRAGLPQCAWGDERSGSLLDIALAQLAPLIPKQAFSPRREALLAAVNGVLGDYLIADQNPLAIPMRLRQNGEALDLTREALASRFVNSDGRLLILAHGLCMNDLQWLRDGHDHGAGLAKEFGYTALYLNYNTGRHISSNGHEFAATLEQLIKAWPVPVRELVIVGHSMGGLISRSACHYAEEAGHAWPEVLKKMVFLGSPHHGAPMERAGNRANLLVGISPYSCTADPVWG